MPALVKQSSHPAANGGEFHSPTSPPHPALETAGVQVGVSREEGESLNGGKVVSGNHVHFDGTSKEESLFGAGQVRACVCSCA